MDGTTRLHACSSARMKTFPPVLTLERTVWTKGAVIVGTGIMARVFLRFPNRFPLLAQEGPCNNIFLLEPVRPINKQRE